MVRKPLQILWILLVFYCTGNSQLPDMKSHKYLLIRCDDTGMCHSLNSAIQRVADTGIPFSTSVMFACPWYQEAVEILVNQTQASVGIHLTLNAEWANYRWGPVLGAAAVPSLVDIFGYFFPSRATFFANQPQITEIEKELRAQIERALNSGLRIDYIDHHMGTAVQTLELRELVESLAKEYNLGISGYFGEVYSNVTYFPAVGTKIDTLLRHLSGLEPGLNLLVMHVGMDTPELQAMKDLNPFGLPEMSRHRHDELYCLIADEFKQAIVANDLKLLNYHDLIKMAGLNNMTRPEIKEYK